MVAFKTSPHSAGSGLGVSKFSFKFLKGTPYMGMYYLPWELLNTRQVAYQLMAWDK